MKEYILMNKQTGKTALGIKLHLFDNVDEEIMSKKELGKISWLPNKPDFFALCTDEDTAFVLLPYEMVSDVTEVIGVI